MIMWRTALSFSSSQWKSPERAVTIDRLLECFDHSLEVDGGLGVDANEVTFVSIPVSGPERFIAGSTVATFLLLALSYSSWANRMRYW